MKKFRIFYLSLTAFALILILPAFIEHTTYLLGGGGLPLIVTGRWDIALVNIVFFAAFIFMLGKKKHTDWRSKNIYISFIIALFAEMYGFPLTAYFIANYMGGVEVDYKPLYNFDFTFMNVNFTLPTMMIVGGLITAVGFILIILGWRRIYGKKKGLQTDGIYRFSRNPQYLGMMIVTFGWIIHWPTPLTLLMWPILTYSYFKLAKSEEEHMKKLYPKEYSKWVKVTPMFL